MKITISYALLYRVVNSTICTPCTAFSCCAPNLLCRSELTLQSYKVNDQVQCTTPTSMFAYTCLPTFHVAIGPPSFDKSPPVCNRRSEECLSHAGGDLQKEDTVSEILESESGESNDAYFDIGSTVILNACIVCTHAHQHWWD